MRNRIAMTRMVCVLCMVFVHVPAGESDTALYAFATDNLGLFLEGLLVEGPGRASAALLSMVSGYLAATALLKPGSSVSRLYRRRFVSIILPMVFWACVTYLVYSVVSQSRPTFVDDATTLLARLNIVFFLTEMPLGATMHLGFLRDLFVCVLLSPLLLSAVRKMAWLLLPILGVFYLVEHNQSAFIILRPLVLFAFTIGLYLAVRQVKLNVLDGYWALFSLLFLLSTVSIMMANGGAFVGAEQWFSARHLQFEETLLYPLSRLFGSLTIWTLMPFFTAGILNNWVQRYSPYLFTAFCSHYLVLTILFFGFWLPVFGARESNAFIIWFLMAPIVSMVVAVLMVQVARRVAPWLAVLITGGRLHEIAPPSSTAIGLAHRRRQGASLGVWLSLLRLSDLVGSVSSAAVREWYKVSRRLLLGRR